MPIVLVALCGAALPAAAQQSADADDLLHLELDELVSIPIVEIAAKRPQSQYHAPALVTVLDRDDIERLSVDSIPDLLRRVPGAFIMQTDAGVFNVGLRGLNQIPNNRVLVLIDGRVMRNLSTEAVTWTALPISMEDVERVEVLHGPGALMYGPNALSGVIHIRTRKPLTEFDADGGAVSIDGSAYSGVYAIKTGDGGVNDDWRLTQGSAANAAVNWANQAGTFGVRTSLGFTGLPLWQEPDPLTSQSGFFNYRMRVTAQYAPTPRTNATLSISHQQSQAAESVSTVADIRPYRHRTQALNFHLHQELPVDGLSTELQIDGQRRKDRSSGVSATNEPRELYLRGMSLWHLALGDGANTLSVGVDGFAQQIVDFASSEPSGLYGAVLAQNEARLLRSPLLLLTAGIRAEQLRLSERDVEAVYREVNPSAALILDLNQRHNLRLVGATGNRNPSGFEMFADFDDFPYGPDEAPFRPLVPNRSLRSTRAVNFELGYNGLLSSKLQVFATVYAQRITDLEGISNQVELPLQFVNVRDVDMVGAEVGGTFAWSKRGRVWGHYSFNYSRDMDTRDRLRDWPSHLAHLGAETALGATTRLAAEVSTWASILPDVLVLDGDTIAQPTATKAQAIVNLHLGQRVLRDRAEVFLAGRNLVSLFRPPEDTRQYVSTRVQPIGASVILGLRISEQL